MEFFWRQDMRIARANQNERNAHRVARRAISFRKEKKQRNRPSGRFQDVFWLAEACDLDRHICKVMIDRDLQPISVS